MKKLLASRAAARKERSAMSLGRRMFISFGLGAVLTLGVFGLRTLSAQQAPAYHSHLQQW